MGGTESAISFKRAREVLGVSPLAGPAELRRAFREAAKRAHPDRSGGDAEGFREVVEAYHRLRDRPAPSDRFFQPPAPIQPAAGPGPLSISPRLALAGGEIEHRTPDGRRMRINLPAGLRSGDRLRAGRLEFDVRVTGEGGMLVRGDDLWITVSLDPRTLDQGGRVAVDTPLGRRVVWITKKAADRGLIRLAGQGLPARGRHRQGHLFFRLTVSAAPADSAARTLLRRFAAAWAA